MAVGHDEEAGPLPQYPGDELAPEAQLAPSEYDEEKLPKKKDRGPYNRMWPKRFTITFWTLDFLMFVAWFGFCAWCINWAGPNDDFVKVEGVPGSPWTMAYTPSAVVAWSSAIMVMSLLFIALEIATVVQCSKNQMRPSLWLSFQCFKLAVYVAAMVTTLITNFSIFIALGLGAVISALSLAQLIYGAVVVHRNRRGFYEANEEDLYDEDGFLIKPDLGPYNRMWPKRFVVTWWSLELFGYVTALGFELFQAIEAQGNSSPTIVHSLYASFLVVCIGMDVASIILFSRASLWPMLYLTFQVGKSALLLIASVLGFLGYVETMMTAMVLMGLSVGPLVFGAVVMHRNRQGFYRENWPLLAPRLDGQDPAPTLQQVCCECGMNRVHDSRSMYSRSIMTPRTGTTLAAYSINSAGEVVRPGMVTPPYSFKGIPEDVASIVPVTSNRQSRATFTSAELDAGPPSPDVTAENQQPPHGETVDEHRT